MNYNSVYSLQHMCAIKLATALCGQSIVRNLLSKLNHLSPKCDEQIEEKIMGMVSELILPQSLTKKVFDSIFPVLLQILEWETCLLNFMYVSNTPAWRCKKIRLRFYSNKLRWTSQGMIDKKKTVQFLIRDESLPVTSRYELACMYCLENDIPDLWNKIPNQHLYYQGERAIEVKDIDLVIFWTYLNKGEITKLNNVIKKQYPNCTPYQFALEYSACLGNKVAIEYFLKKLPPEEQDKLLVKCAQYVSDKHYHFVYERVFACEECHSQSLRYLLSRMNEGQQMEVFTHYPQRVLMSFLDWPCHIFFIPTAEFILNFLPMKDCKNLLRNIVDKVYFGYKNCGYEKLFADFWQKMPDSYKRYVIDDSHSFGVLLLVLFMVEDRENIEVILKYATSKDRKEIIFSTHGQSICYHLCYGRKFDLFKFFIEQCVPSKAIMTDFRHMFREFMNLTYSKSLGKDIWNMVQQTLDNISEEMDKRKLKKDTSISAKRFCISSD